MLPAQFTVAGVRMQALNIQSLNPIVGMHSPTPPSYEDVVQMTKCASSLLPVYNAATQTAWKCEGELTNITTQQHNAMDEEMFLNDTRKSYHFLKFVMIILMFFMLLFVLAWTSLAMDGCL
jgi:hypothetical protein